MADKETGLFIPVSAYADKDSAKSAINDLTKGLLSSLKDGYIEVPAEIKASFTRGSKELEKAQKDVIKVYEKMSKEGFSSSVDDLDDLIEKYRKFKSLAGKEGKGNSKQTKWLSKTIGETLQPYLAQKRELEKIVASFEDSVAKIEKSTKKSTGKRTRKVKEAYIPSDEEITADIAKHKKRQEKGLGGITKKLDVKSPSMDPGNTNSYELQNSERSSYKSNFARQQRQSEKEFYKDPKHQAITKRVTEEEINKAIMKAFEDGGNTRTLTNSEKAGELSGVLLGNLKNILKDIEAGGPDASSDDFFKTLETIFKLDQIAGRKTFDTIKKSLNATLDKYYNTKGIIGGTNGEDKTEATRKPQIEKLLKEFLSEIGKLETQLDVLDDIVTANKTSVSRKDNSLLNKVIADVENTAQEIAELENTTGQQLKTDRTSYTQDIRESTREGMADAAEGRANKEELAVEQDSLHTIEGDASTGFNTDSKSDELIKTIQNIGKTLNTTLSQIQGSLQNIFSKPVEIEGQVTQKEQKEDKQQGLLPGYLNQETGKWVKSRVRNKMKRKEEPMRVIPTEEQEKRAYEKPGKREKRINDPDTVKAINKELAQIESGEHESQKRQFVESSEINTYQKGIVGAIQKAFKGLGWQSEVDKIMSANAEEQERMRAERIETFGLNRGKDLTDTGDVADAKRVKSLYGWFRGSDQKNKELMKDIRLTEGFTGKSSIDTTKIMGALNKVLSGPEMFKAQTGGTFRNLIGSMTGYIGMDSLEKSRAQAEGLNQVMANVRKEVLSLIQDIQSKEATLQGMQDMGTARFTSDGRLAEGSSSAAENIFTKLEEQKGVLKAALAEVAMIDKVVGKSHGKVKSIVKNLGFVMPELMQNNTIIQNINAGLDKNGKALKFQKRTAETLNYTFQLMARHIGQMWKNWMMQLNPITQIKRAFQDFMSYNPKWQRTMNVVKYNLRDIILPMMEKIAQLLVNMIGFADIILQKVQKAFGKSPISLFDQKNADKAKKTYEDMYDISAGFDELHDIGQSASDNDANNLLGEIYKPQLSPEWQKFAEDIGDLFAGIITGDLGFGDVMKEILRLAVEGIKLIGGEIWKALKNSTVGQYIQKHWKEILGWIAAAFLGWKFLKWAGGKLFSALFGNFTFSGIKGIFSKVGGWITKALGATAFGKGIIEGITSVFTGKGGLLATLKSIFVGKDAITAFGAWGETLGALFIQSVGVAIGGGMVMKGFDMVADDESYNIGLEEAGGDEKDKKSGAGGRILGTIGGAIAGGFVTGGPIGAAIGAIAGLLVTSLAPAFETVEVASRNANNEMQKIEYYQGKVQGASTEVEKLDELSKLLNDTLQVQTDKVIAEGEQLGISRDRMIELTNAVMNGTFHTDLLTGSEVALTDSLLNLSDQQQKNEEATIRLRDAKKKLQKAELDLAIAEDVAAGNFELAAARIEYAVATELMTVDEGTQKMVQIAKEGSAEQATAMLRNLSPELQKKFQSEYSTTEEGLNELTDLYYEYSKDEREYFIQNLTGEVQREMQARVNAIKQAVENAPWWKRLLDIGNDGKIWGQYYVDVPAPSSTGNTRSVVPSMSVGTNYVPNDGLVYLHQGEAVIPKKYNQPYQQPGMTAEERAYMSQMMNTMRSLDSTMKQGITVNGQFTQRGSDLVAVVNRTKSQTGADLLSNVAYAR